MEKETILIVDDEPDLIELVTVVLQKKGYKILAAENGIRALELARKHMPTLILLDIMMPGLDGFEVCQRLRDNFYTSHIPIIVLTCREEVENKVKGLNIGADDYITKPFNFSELVMRVRAVLRRTYTERNSSPLTQLPGSNLIGEQIKKRLKLNIPSAFLYIDLNDFKAYNDRYGYKRGDEVIKRLAEIICNSVREYGDKDDFVGHIGGDDFISIVAPDKSKIIADNIIKNLMDFSKILFDDQDLKNGYIEIKDRKGNTIKYPAELTIVIAGVSNQYGEINSHIQVSDFLAEVKRFLKKKGSNGFMMDRRSHKE